MFKKGKIIVLFSVLAAVISVGAAGCGNRDNGEVNIKKIVTKEAVEKKAKEIEAAIKSSQKGKEIPEAVKKNIYKQAKESLEREAGLLTIAQQEKIKINDKDIDKQFERIKKTLGRDKGGFKGLLKRENKTEAEFKEMLKKQLIMSELRKKLSKGIKVTDKQIKEFYEKNKSSFVDPKDNKKVRSLEQVKPMIRQIIISQEISKLMEARIKVKK